MIFKILLPILIMIIAVILIVFGIKSAVSTSKNNKTENKDKLMQYYSLEAVLGVGIFLVGLYFLISVI